jgi:DNA-damage-inducible protein D
MRYRRVGMNEVKKYNEKTFEDIKHIDAFGNEYWDARELMPLLEYSKWENFHKVIKSAMVACETSNYSVCDHFPEFRKMVDIGSKTKRGTIDYHLSRYACYLIVQNANPKKESVALGQTYFAVQTRKQEISEIEYGMLTEEEKRFYQRNLTKKGNYSLNRTAVKSGVKNLDKFHNAGYKGLYNGETANDIAKRKKLRYREDILDNMGSVELAANLFRITQTEQKLINDKVQTEKEANKVHYTIGKNIREVIAKNGGTMPEKLSTPKKSLKELEREKKELNKIGTK